MFIEAQEGFVVCQGQNDGFGNVFLDSMDCQVARATTFHEKREAFVPHAADFLIHLGDQVLGTFGNQSKPVEEILIWPNLATNFMIQSNLAKSDF